MDYHSAAEILSALLALLFLLYVRNKRKAAQNLHDHPQLLGRKSRFDTADDTPDLISKTAGGIYKVHTFYSRIIAVFVIAVVLVGAVFDPLTRIIVLATISALILIAMVGKVWQKNKLK